MAALSTTGHSLYSILVHQRQPANGDGSPIRMVMWADSMIVCRGLQLVDFMALLDQGFLPIPAHAFDGVLAFGGS